MHDKRSNGLNCILAVHLVKQYCPLSLSHINFKCHPKFIHLRHIGSIAKCKYKIVKESSLILLIVSIPGTLQYVCNQIEES